MQDNNHLIQIPIPTTIQSWFSSLIEDAMMHVVTDNNNNNNDDDDEINNNNPLVLPTNDENKTSINTILHSSANNVNRILSNTNDVLLKNATKTLRDVSEVVSTIVQDSQVIQTTLLSNSNIGLKNASDTLREVVTTLFIDDDYKNKDGIDHFTNRLPDVLILSIFKYYLNEQDLGNTRQTCKKLHTVLDPYGRGEIVWSRYWKEWNVSNHTRYLSARLRHTRNEIIYYQAIVKQGEALTRVEDEVIALAGSIGKFKTAEIAHAIARRRPAALFGVVISDPSTAAQFRKRSPLFDQSISFMLSTTSAAAPRPPIEAPGFIGYALDLLELRPEEEHLRETVLASFIYRDMTVWETLQDVEYAIQNGLYISDSEIPFFTVLDDTRPIQQILLDDAPRNDHDEGGARRRSHFVTAITAPYHKFRSFGVRGIQERIHQLREMQTSLELINGAVV
jgi:hypothetical protein